VLLRLLEPKQIHLAAVQPTPRRRRPRPIYRIDRRFIDNAVAESSLKTELIYWQSWASRHDAELAIFAWIEDWYNPERIMAGRHVQSRCI